MDWTFLLITVIAVVAVFGLKRPSYVSVAIARRHLADGAPVIDVRSPSEFAGGHLAIARNIPLGDLRQRVPAEFPDRGMVLLVHCLSGGRSLVARRQLIALGYRNVFNLGSLSRARSIVEGAR